MNRLRPFFTVVLLIPLTFACGQRPRGASRVSDSPASPFKTFMVHGVPAAASACDTESSGIKERFARATNIQPYRAECVPGDDGLDITVTYVSADRLPFVRAEFGLFGSADPDPTFPTGLERPLWGTYSSFAECAAHLGERRSDFEAETGLSAVAWSCFQGMQGKFVARIDGFGGTPEKRFYNLEVEFQGQADQDFADDVSALLVRQGASVRGAIPWGGYVIVMFYSPTPLTVDARTIGFQGQVETLEACNTELDEAVRTITAIMGRSPGIARCLRDSFDSTAHLNMAYSTQDRLPAYWQESGPIYGTYQNCLTDRSNVLAEFRHATSRDARGVVCVMESTLLPSKYKAILIGTNG